MLHPLTKLGGPVGGTIAGGIMLGTMIGAPIGNAIAGTIDKSTLNLGGVLIEKMREEAIN